MKTNRNAAALQIANLLATLETLTNRANEVPSKSNLARIKAVRLELAEVRGA